MGTGAKEQSKKGPIIPPCEYFKKFQSGQNQLLREYSRKLCDIEDLFKEGQEEGFCPYFLQKKLLVKHLSSQ